MSAITPVEATSGWARPVTVRFDGGSITIQRGLLGRNETRIPISRVTAVNFRRGLTGRGYIEFLGVGEDARVDFAIWKASQFEALAASVSAALAGP
jgi:hypothetical protein